MIVSRYTYKLNKKSTIDIVMIQTVLKSISCGFATALLLLIAISKVIKIPESDTFYSMGNINLIGEYSIILPMLTHVLACVTYVAQFVYCYSNAKKNRRIVYPIVLTILIIKCYTSGYIPLAFAITSITFTCVVTTTTLISIILSNLDKPSKIDKFCLDYEDSI